MNDHVLLYIKRNNEYLLLYRNKKEKDLNKGKYIGVGGKVEQGETIEEALIRETKEETGLTINSYQYRGILHFDIDGYIEDTHLYTSDDFEGEVIECNEGELSFIDIDRVSSLPLWEGDKIFLKYLKDNEPFFELILVYKNDILVSWEKING